MEKKLKALKHVIFGNVLIPAWSILVIILVIAITMITDKTDTEIVEKIVEVKGECDYNKCEENKVTYEEIMEKDEEIFMLSANLLDSNLENLYSPLTIKHSLTIYISKRDKLAIERKELLNRLK